MKCLSACVPHKNLILSHPLAEDVGLGIFTHRAYPSFVSPSGPWMYAASKRGSHRSVPCVRSSRGVILMDHAAGQYGGQVIRLQPQIGLSWDEGSWDLRGLLSVPQTLPMPPHPAIVNYTGLCPSLSTSMISLLSSYPQVRRCLGTARSAQGPKIGIDRESLLESKVVYQNGIATSTCSWLRTSPS